MRVLLTGAFGTIGQPALHFLSKKNHSIRCFELPTKKNRQIGKKLARKIPFELVWGDIRNRTDVERTASDVDVVIHLAAMIAPHSERSPELAHDVNVLGTQNMIQCAKSAGISKFIFASSFTTYGSTMSMPPPRKVGDPQMAINHYSEHKITCEKMLLESGLPATIMRLAVVLDPNRIAQLDPEMFNIPLAQRIELLHPLDAGRAIANAVAADTIGKILHLGGGPDWQITYEKLMKNVLTLFGLGMFPANAFRVPASDHDWYYTDWLDTSEAQSLLKFQTVSSQQFLDECRSNTKTLRLFAYPLRKIITWFLLRSSNDRNGV